jgi:hypothetical protein
MPCSHEWRDIKPWRQLVGNFLVAPDIEAGNPRAMQPRHTYICWKCEQTLPIPEEGGEIHVPL